MTNKQKRQTFWQQNHAIITSGILATIIATLVLNISGAFGSFFTNLYATLGVYDYYASLDIATVLLIATGGLALWRAAAMRRSQLAEKRTKPTLYTGKKAYSTIVSATVLLMGGAIGFNVYHRLHDPQQFVIVVAQFAGSRPEEHMIPQRLEKVFRDQRRKDIIVKLTPQTVTNETEAERIGRQHRAAAVIYGFYHNDTPQEIVAYAHLTRDVVVDRAVSLSRTEERVMTGTIDSSITTKKNTLTFGMAVNQTNSGIAQLGLFLCGIQQLNQKQYAAAAGSFDNALDQSESHQHLSADTLRYYRALANHARDRFDSAKSDFEAVLASRNKVSTPMQANANHALGDIAYIRKQYREADLRYSKAIGLNHNDLDAYTNRGFARDDLNRFDEALADFDKAIVLSKTYVKRYAYPHNGRGVVFWQQKNYNRALQEFDTAIKIDKKYADPLINKAQVLADKKDFAGSMKLFDEALKLHPRNAIAYYNRATVQDLQHKRDAAIADYTQAIKYDAKYTNAYNNRGALYLEREAYDKSIADFDAAIRLEPDKGSLYHNRAGAFYSKGVLLYVNEATTKQGYDLIVRADDDIDKAIRLRPDIAAGYAIRGQIFMLLGGKEFYDNALAEFDKAVVRDNKNAKVYKARGLIFESKEQYAEATVNYQRGRAIDPKDPDYYYAEGRSYIRSNDYNKALAAYNEAVVLAPDKPDPYLQRAMFYLSQKDKAKAKADARKIIEMDKDGKKSAAAKTILEL